MSNTDPNQASEAEDLFKYRPELLEPQYRWKGDGPPPARWKAPDGTIVYRSYADYCLD